MISVIIATYNHRNFILDTLESVWRQSPGYEIIVVNDGSPDDTERLLAPLEAQGRIRYFRQENRGQAAARNRGLHEARGEYVAFLDDDDLWPPDKLAWQEAVLERHPDAALVYGEHLCLMPDGQTRAPAPLPRPQGSVYDAFLEACRISSPGQTLIRTDALRAIGGFDESIRHSDDWDMYLRLARHGAFLYENRLALYYRLHDRNASVRLATEHAANHWKVVWKHMGWRFFTMNAHRRNAAHYFTPRLLRCGDEARRTGEYAGARRAYLHALCFAPGLAFRRSFWGRMAGGLLHRPPQQDAAPAGASRK